MILDERSELADATTIATATGRTLHGDVIDLGINTRHAGEELYFVVQITAPVTSAGAATVAFELSSDSQANIAVDGTASLHFATGPIPKATLIAGFVALSTKLVQRAQPYERFVGLITNVGTAALTGGACNAFLTHKPSQWRAFADAI